MTLRTFLFFNPLQFRAFKNRDEQGWFWKSIRQVMSTLQVQYSHRKKEISWVCSFINCTGPYKPRGAGGELQIFANFNFLWIEQNSVKMKNSTKSQNWLKIFKVYWFYNIGIDDDTRDGILSVINF